MHRYDSAVPLQDDPARCPAKQHANVAGIGAVRGRLPHAAALVAALAEALAAAAVGRVASLAVVVEVPAGFVLARAPGQGSSSPSVGAAPAHQRATGTATRSWQPGC
mmetsp:Transcript_47962/g.112058  ORF Transcript_47962/g.112058 Transcript_47962/m.112058 type:complete len:107 (-) Transcript_47962:1084-1404(-)